MDDAALKALRRPATGTTPGITNAQKDFILLLLDEREADPKMGLSTEEIRERIDHLSVSDASAWIKRLKELPRHPPQPVATRSTMSFPDVPAGRYAVEDEGVLKFYRVDRPTEGRWAGWTFLSVQASDELHPIKASMRKKAILAEIKKDVLGASARYGREIGACGVCGTTLTNEESRRIGIGPICRRKLAANV